MINVLLALHMGLAFAFNYIPEFARVAISAMLLVGYTAIAARVVLQGQRAALAMALCIAALAFAWALSFAFFSGIGLAPSLDAALRGVVPFMCGISVLFRFERVSARMLRLLALCGAVLALATTLSTPGVVVGGVYRPFPFAADLHTSAYLVALVGILVWEIRPTKWPQRFIAVVTVVICAYLVTSYAVRTAQLVVLVYTAFRMTIYLRDRHLGRALFGALSLIVPIGLLGASIYLLSTDNDTLNAFSSGRLANYAERFDILDDRGLWRLAFGTGPGTDMIITSVWWWDAKNSHSDFLQTFWESGAVGLLAVLVYLGQVYNLNRLATLPAIAAILLSSTVSNALLTRPNAAFLIFCIIALQIGKREARSAGQAIEEPTSSNSLTNRSAALAGST